MGSVAFSWSQNRIASSRCAAVRAMPRHAQRTVSAPAVPCTARCTGEAPARCNPSFSNSSTVGGGRSSLEAATPRLADNRSPASVISRAAVDAAATTSPPGIPPDSLAIESGAPSLGAAIPGRPSCCCAVEAVCPASRSLQANATDATASATPKSDTSRARRPAFMAAPPHRPDTPQGGFRYPEQLLEPNRIRPARAEGTPAADCRRA